MILLTIGMAVYAQPLMLAEWFRCYREASEAPTDTQVLVVDDCGTPPATVPRDPWVRLLRITEDKPWNQGEARNLAACEASGRVLLMLDPDMTLPPSSLPAFIAAATALPPKRVVRPVLRHADGRIDKSSPNVYLIHREDFLRCGYDLCYSGAKGWGDVELSNLWRRLYKERTDETLILDFHHGGKFSDAQVTSISRDYTRNRKLHLARHARCAKVGLAQFVKERSQMVRSPWERVR